ncbi:MAG TPA: DUF1015 domain-containing protein [Thermodesulfobacteriota bacterium]|nr:DUF1015 domain-containing protein [Deltaproteobacteria bacterium]HNR13709.1 DUF1015 domain-containing protein [Thermodesulfobacteriota bacterium]HNU70926.1 DUF1015 domain-containing protein [Thermodesulfobacteriota bacterium]HOC38361.1 DUF1015 domain-containing protein [Thermodesulfobacteriota bacterium]
MVCIRPFTGWLYNRDTIDTLELVVAPPYDVITPAQQEQYYQRHPYNVIRLILGKEEPGDNDQANKYTRAAAYLSSWQKEGILKQVPKPALYFYAQDYVLPNEGSRRRKGFISLIRLEDFSAKAVLPHEKTLSKPKVDRLNLTLACRANFNPVFSLYADPSCTVESHMDAISTTPAYVDVTDDNGVRHQLWAVNDPAVINDVVTTLADKQVLIADGHHRYETALNYRNLMRQQYPNATGNEAFNYTMMYFSNMNDVGLVILPTHRIVKNLSFSLSDFLAKASRFFDVESIPAGRENDDQVRRTVMSTMGQESAGRFVFALYVKQDERYHVFRLKRYDLLDAEIVGTASPALRHLDTYIVESLLFQKFLGISASDANREDHMAFAHADEEAVALVKNGGYEAAFLVNTTRIEQVQDIVTQGEIMPQKSTYFYPKLYSGLVIRTIDPETIIS